MARVAVLIDRAPGDPDWKGGAAWTIINALSESQHDVQVFTPLNPDRLGVIHPRVNVARPAKNFALTTMVSWGRALAQYQPDVIHTFAPHSARFPKLTIWPYLEGLAPVLPRARRLVTLFDASDVSRDHVAARWVGGHARWSVFDPDLTLSDDHRHEFDRLNVDDVLPAPAPVPADPTAETAPTLVPAPLSEWVDVDRAVANLASALRDDPNLRVRIIGGWGDTPPSERRRVWTTLGDLGARVHLGEALSLAEFVRDARAAQGLWTEALRPGSWRALVAARVRAGRSGDTINQLSRIYSTAGRW